jgi:hypothetical protein
LDAECSFDRSIWVAVGKSIQDRDKPIGWQLYDISKDWTQIRKVAAANLAKLRAMQGRVSDGFAKSQALRAGCVGGDATYYSATGMTAGRTALSNWAGW